MWTARRHTVTLLGAFLLLIGASCTKENASYCDSDSDCPSGVCDLARHECVEGDAGPSDARTDAWSQDARVRDAEPDVQAQDAEPDAEPPECETSADCAEAQRPICDQGACRACQDSDECANLDPNRPICADSGQCVAPNCGNGLREVGEDCDGTDLGGGTCTDFGFDAGDLACTQDCTFDTSDCHTCGNGTREGPEDCDATDLGGRSCTDFGFDAGDLACTQDCTFDTSDCHTCGNGTREGPEDCDGSDLAGQTCASLTGLSQGQPRCTASCTFDTSDCHQCGNGTIEGPEDCDGSNLNGQTCASLTGLSQGQPRCTASCTFDTSDCHQCGNGTREGPEQCDGLDLGGQSCATVSSYSQGDLHCTGSCIFDTSGCHTCGNGEIEGPEVCDSNDLGDATGCGTFGFKFGDLACGPDCTDYDLSDCTNCGDGICDLSGGDSTSSCPQDCGWIDVSAGGETTCGVKADGTVWCWGDNQYAQLGTGQPGPDSDTPVQVFLPNQALAQSVAVGNGHVCALDRDGNVYCWGLNDRYQCARTHGTTWAPTLINGLDPADVLEVGADFTCARTTSGFRCWGGNQYGQMAQGSTSWGLATPTCPKYSSGNCMGTFEQLLAHSTGYHMCHPWSMFSVNPPRLYYGLECWGRNHAGQIGDGTTSNALWVTSVADLDAQADLVAAGTNHTCATQGSSLYCWGDNSSGQLGDNSTVDHLTPNLVPGISNVSALAAGDSFTCASTGTETYCWGSNSFGQLGVGDNQDRRSPTQVPALSGLQVEELTAGLSHACARLSDGSLRCWGSNTDGQLGNGTFSNTDEPVPVEDPYEP